ncbi:head-tail adaptor protein [Moraxella nonliquefaciens]|uniref:phage head closure protein n=1 Tax=Moraxella nonliquefaciens TaxID=478 RepID=UPI0024A65447|nr:phage head closure protein [Moraxella nonliquefaciens]MDI4498772.1 head-tail adaptor protein [Moraxella nonliquefaciens]MDI4500537.1 head-tail adaptor protein [Moraxella nonliquefaciens]
MTIGAGKLRHRIKFYRATTTRSVTGAVSHEWEHILTLWGQFIPLSVKDIIAGQAEQTHITARAIIRHRTDIDHTMRVQYAGRMYEIVGEPLADNNTGQEYLTLMLKGVADDRQN